MESGFWNLPDGFETFSDSDWLDWHRYRADALGATYDEGLADRHVGFFRVLRHSTGKWAGKRFEPLAWQEHQIIRPLFGYVDPPETPDGRPLRIFSTVFVAVPKKNGKSELAAGLALDLTCFDGEAGAQVYGAAKDRDQAGLVFGVASAMVKECASLGKRLKVVDSTKRIVHARSGSFYRAVSSDTGGKHGYNTHALICDEEHAIDDAEYVRTLRFGAGDAREQPVFFFITTAGHDRSSICFADWQYANDVRYGRIEDRTWLPVVYELDETDDWEDESNWYKCNPSLGVTIDIEKVRTAYKTAKSRPSEENVFRRLRLNQWTSQDTRWLPMAEFDACGVLDERGHVPSLAVLAQEREKLEAEMLGRQGYAWLDLSTKTDITTAGIAFPLEDGRVAVLPRFYLPRENLDKREDRDRALYSDWARYGFVELTDGPVTDYDAVRDDLIALRERGFKFQEIAYDDWNAGKIEQTLATDGFLMVATPQSMKSLSAPTKHLLELTLSKKLVTAGNPVLRYMADNLVVEQDSNERVRPTKAKSNGRIDGIVGVIMALDRVLRHEEAEPSVYEGRGLLVF